MGRLRSAGDLSIKRLTHRSIRPYGIIIDAACVKDTGKGNDFGVLLKERSKGWRIGYLIVRKNTIRRLEKHPDSLETFEPVKGKLVIAFAENRHPDKINFFLLDKPVVVKKGVWHEVASLKGRSEVKIFENIEVRTEYHEIKNGYLFQDTRF